MTLHRAYVGLGSNVGDRADNLARAFAALREIGRAFHRSSIYRTAPWGRTDQPEFFNAVASFDTELSPHELLDSLRTIEVQLGREPGERWGPRVIDLDILLYDDVTIADERLRLPHEHLSERAFALVPLAEIDQRFVAMRDALDPDDRAGVIPFERESDDLMSSEDAHGVRERVRALAEFLSGGDATRVRIARGDEVIELTSRRRNAVAASRSSDGLLSDSKPLRVDSIRADLVGIFHLGRPAPFEGEVFDGDRELGFIEALGIRTPVHSMGAGRVVTVAAADESPVEYGQTLFSIARG